MLNRGWVSAFAVVLTACGGGGGGGGSNADIEALGLSFSYPQPSAAVWTDTTISPLINGLEGNSPRCSLVSGVLPLGLELNRNCTLTGQPLGNGNFSATIRLTVEGYRGYVDANVTFVVGAPGVHYWDLFGNTRLTWGQAYSFAPTIGNGGAIPAPGDTLRYELVGTLPAGMSFNTTTGYISGTPTRPDDFASFSVEATVTRAGRTHVFTSLGYSPTVASPPYHVAYSTTRYYSLGESISIAPALFDIPDDAVLHYSIQPNEGGNLSLPTGLSIDPSTGLISGVATGTIFGNVGIRIEVVRNGLSHVLETAVFLAVQ